MRPRASVGMPVFNRAASVARGIESVLAQTFPDFELIVSDNASSDGTEPICRRYAAQDPRIRYTRHPATISGLDNFRFVLDTARAPYFMWLPADDYVLPRLLELAVAVLDTRPDVVCAVPGAEFLEADGSRRPAPGSFPLLGEPLDNICRYLADPMDNSRFYGLYRRDLLRAVLPAEAYYGFDWVVAAGTLLHGKHVELPELLLVREANERDKYTRMIDMLARGPLERLLPLGRFSHALLGRLRARPHPRLLYALLRINIIHHVMYCQYRYPRYGNLAHRLGAGLERIGAGAWRALHRRMAA
ncbi:MAG TPA: glycosyltransferase family 2 protein [Methylomirabilota bacterium]|jgi:glycosyltransferase involved in cell wall biosynthesis|nr:glycosyltransferase family 2 protein [Methylomirabilota bacterium]